MTPISISYAFRPARRSLDTAEISDLFGLSGSEPPIVICDNFCETVEPGQIALFTGPSGSGKSSILRAIATRVGAVDAMGLVLGDAPLVELLPGPMASRLDMLGACGLSEARLMLRTPAELSDGQRYRFRLALAMTDPATFLVADEFAAYLDRTLAKVLAFNLRKLVRRSGKGILLATTHEDITDDLDPDLWVRCGTSAGIEVVRREGDVKKKSRSLASCDSPKVPEATGRISLGGIIGRTTSRASVGS